MDKDRKLIKAFMWQRLTEGEIGSCSDGWGHVAHQTGIKSLIQFSVDGQSWVPSLFFHLRPNYGGGIEDNGDLFQKALCMHCCTQCPRPCSSHHRPMPPPETLGHTWTSLDQFLVGSLLLSPGSWYTQGFVCALQESVSFWWLCGGVNGNLLQELMPYPGLLHPEPCPCGRPLVTHTSAGDTQTFKGRTDSLYGFSGCTQGFVSAL